MKFLIDNALPPRLAELLYAAGYDAVHVGQYFMHAAEDKDILARALREQRTVVSTDTDFGTLLAAQNAGQPSFILSRQTNLLVAQDYFALLVPALGVLEPELVDGCVAVFRNDRLRVRKLPFSR